MPFRMARASRFRTRSMTRRRRFEWVAFSTNEQVIVLGAATPVQFNPFVAEAIGTMTSPTLTRIRGEILCRVQAGASPASENITLFMGIQAQPAAVDDVTSVEVPSTDGFSNRWLWWNVAHLVVIDPAGLPLELASTISAKRIEVDARAKRKLSEGDELVFVTSVAIDSASLTSVVVQFSGRALFQEA